MPRAKAKPVIRASEIGEYVYCSRAWWLRRVAGEEPSGHERRALGTFLHARHGRAVLVSGWLMLLAIGLLAVAFGLFLLG